MLFGAWLTQSSTHFRLHLLHSRSLALEKLQKTPDKNAFFTAWNQFTLLALLGVIWFHALKNAF